MSTEYRPPEAAKPEAAPPPTAPSLPGNAAPAGDLIPLDLPHDLAIQVIGSDAGKEKRIRPHGAMLRGASAEEIETVKAALQPIQELEIKRVHEGCHYSSRLHHLQVSRAAALAIKGFCLRFVENQRQHLNKDPGNDRLYRTRQRLNQALDVIRQIDLALGVPVDPLLQTEAKADALRRLGEILPSLKSLQDQADSQDSMATRLASLIAPIESVLAG